MFGTFKNFFGVGEESEEVVEQWESLAEKKVKVSLNLTHI